MTRVRDADVRGIFGFVGSMVPGTPTEPLTLPVLKNLEALIGADATCYFELRRADRGVIAYTTTSEPPLAPGSGEAQLTFGHQNPIGWRKWRPADGALRFSAMAPRQSLERLEFTRYFMWPNRIRDSLKVWLWSSHQSAACVLLDRADSDFSRREQDILAILQSHLIDLRSRALAGPPPLVPVDAALTPREVEVLTWAARGWSDEEIGALLTISVGTVGKHLEHAYDKLGVHSRPEALALMSQSNPTH
jgi:DNA-binding CsgD family transcriptional regulator